MTDVFISYAREDRDWVEMLAASLEAESIAVWWDRQLAGGAEFHKETEARLNAAKAIVVVWSKASIDSMWVSDEATVGREKGTLIPIAIEAVTPKLGFRGLHTIDLARWKGNRAAPEFVDLVRALKTRISDEAPSPMAPVQRRPWSKRPVVLAAIGTALLVGIGLLAYWQSAPSRATPTARPASATAAPAAGSISVAVLPFLNLSGDPAQEFFSDGMTEEITSALVKVSGLSVIGRTSAFAFKGQNKDLRTIGQALNASHLIEGSVRKSGNRVLITAQLIRTDTGTHLWTDSYERELKDIFAIQEEIAKAIAGALRVPLGLKALVANRTQDPETYQQYLQAYALKNTGTLKAANEAVALLEQVVKREPNYAPAWSLLSHVYSAKINRDPVLLMTGPAESARRTIDEYLAKEEAAAQRAVQLDPNDSKSYLALGDVQWNRNQLVAASDNFSKALALDPQNPDVLNESSGLLGNAGHVKEALAIHQQVYAVEPFVPVNKLQTQIFLWLNGQNDAAIDIIKSMDILVRSRRLPQIYASMGRYGEAADLILQTPPGVYPREVIETAARLLRTAPATAASPQTLPDLGNFDFVYLYIGAPERSLQPYESSLERGVAALGAFNLWHPSYAAVRKTERFKAYIRKLGLVEYWRAKGWPEFCRPVGKDDFACH